MEIGARHGVCAACALKDLPRYGEVADSADAKGNNDGEVSISELDAYQQRNLEAQLKAADEPDVKDVLERRIYSVQFARDELGAALADPVNQTTAELERLVKIAGKVLDASFATPSSSPAERASIDQRMTVVIDGYKLSPADANAVRRLARGLLELPMTSQSKRAENDRFFKVEPFARAVAAAKLTTAAVRYAEALQAAKAVGVQVGAGANPAAVIGKAQRSQAKALVGDAWTQNGRFEHIDAQLLPLLKSSDPSTQTRVNLYLQELVRPNVEVETYTNCKYERTSSWIEELICWIQHTFHHA